MPEYGFGKAAAQIGDAIGQSSQISSNRRNMEERQMAIMEYEKSIEDLSEREILAKGTIANHNIALRQEANNSMANKIADIELSTEWTNISASTEAIESLNNHYEETIADVNSRYIKDPTIADTGLAQFREGLENNFLNNRTALLRIAHAGARTRSLIATTDALHNASQSLSESAVASENGQDLIEHLSIFGRAFGDAVSTATQPVVFDLGDEAIDLSGLGPEVLDGLDKIGSQALGNALSLASEDAFIGAVSGILSLPDNHPLNAFDIKDLVRDQVARLIPIINSRVSTEGRESRSKALEKKLGLIQLSYQDAGDPYGDRFRQERDMVAHGLMAEYQTDLNKLVALGVLSKDQMKDMLRQESLVIQTASPQQTSIAERVSHYERLNGIDPGSPFNFIAFNSAIGSNNPLSEDDLAYILNQAAMLLDGSGEEFAENQRRFFESLRHQKDWNFDYSSATDSQRREFDRFKKVLKSSRSLEELVKNMDESIESRVTHASGSGASSNLKIFVTNFSTGIPKPKNISPIDLLGRSLGGAFITPKYFEDTSGFEITGGEGDPWDHRSRTASSIVINELSDHSIEALLKLTGESPQIPGWPKVIVSASGRKRAVEANGGSLEGVGQNLSVLFRAVVSKGLGDPKLSSMSHEEFNKQMKYRGIFLVNSADGGLDAWRKDSRGQTTRLTGSDGLPIRIGRKTFNQFVELASQPKGFFEDPSDWMVERLGRGESLTGDPFIDIEISSNPSLGEGLGWNHKLNKFFDKPPLEDWQREIFFESNSQLRDLGPTLDVSEPSMMGSRSVAGKEKYATSASIEGLGGLSREERRILFDQNSIFPFISPLAMGISWVGEQIGAIPDANPTTLQIITQMSPEFFSALPSETQSKISSIRNLLDVWNFNGRPQNLNSIIEGAMAQVALDFRIESARLSGNDIDNGDFDEIMAATDGNLLEDLKTMIGYYSEEIDAQPVTYSERDAYDAQQAAWIKSIVDETSEVQAIPIKVMSGQNVISAASNLGPGEEAIAFSIEKTNISSQELLGQTFYSSIESFSNGKQNNIEIKESPNGGTMIRLTGVTVEDGDTFVVDRDGGGWRITSEMPKELKRALSWESVPSEENQFTTREIGIDTPEIIKVWRNSYGDRDGISATMFAVRALNGSTVYVQPILDKDGKPSFGYYGRALVKTWFEKNGITYDFGEEILRGGEASFKPGGITQSNVLGSSYEGMEAALREAREINIGINRPSDHVVTLTNRKNLMEYTSNHQDNDYGISPFYIHVSTVHGDDAFIIPSIDPSSGEPFGSPEEAWSELGINLAKQNMIFPYEDKKSAIRDAAILLREAKRINGDPIREFLRMRYQIAVDRPPGKDLDAWEKSMRDSIKDIGASDVEIAAFFEDWDTRKSHMIPLPKHMEKTILRWRGTN